MTIVWSTTIWTTYNNTAGRDNIQYRRGESLTVAQAITSLCALSIAVAGVKRDYTGQQSQGETMVDALQARQQDLWRIRQVGRYLATGWM